VERRLSAILFTDVVGYSTLMGRDEAAARRVRTRHESLVREQITRYDGRWIEEKGDESLSVFPSALQAVGCALAIQTELARDAGFQVRIGIHLGDVTLEGGRVYGDGVNVAARIYPLAEPGEIAVSGLVHDSIKNQPGVEVVCKGEQTLKNVAVPVMVWSVTGTLDPPKASARVPAAASRRGFRTAAALAVAVILIGLLVLWNSRPQVGSTPIRSVAVLPLHDSSSDEVGGYLSFGMTEALITELAKLGDLSVISRTSVTPYETTDLSIPEIAAELGVDGIIEGSVLRSGERVRVTAQLIDARSDTHIWAESYDRDAGDVLALHAELARAIAREVQVEVSPTPPVGTGSTRPISPDAYEAYLKGYYFQMKRTREDTNRAVRYFLKVIELEPDHPLGYSGLADEYSCAPTHSWSIVSSELWPSVPSEIIARARSNAQRALELDPASGPAHNSIALVHMFGNWDWSAAEAEFLEAIKLSPGRAWAHSTYAYLLAFQRRFDEAIVHLERARALDPLRVETTMDMAALQVWTGNRDEAYRFWKEAEEIMPGYAGLHQAVITGFCGTERHAEALAVLEGASATYPEDPPIIGETAYCHAVAGDAPRARELLAKLDGLAGALYVSPVSLAMVHVGLGDHDRAFEELKRGVRERDFLLPYIGVDGTWDPLRTDPRFSELLDHIGLPQA